MSETVTTYLNKPATRREQKLFAWLTYILGVVTGLMLRWVW